MGVMSRKQTERQPLGHIRRARAFYPKYFEDYDIQADMDMVEQARRYEDYRDMGGFLDKLTYFEIKSLMRSDESRKDISRSRTTPPRRKPMSKKVDKDTNYEDIKTMGDVRIPGTPFVVEKGDVIRVYKK